MKTANLPARASAAAASARPLCPASRRRSLLWRIHFWAALIASPFALAAAMSGILYLFTPQIETALYGKIERVTPAGSLRPLDASVAAARQAMPPDWTVKAVYPPPDAQAAVRVLLAPPIPHAHAAAHEHIHATQPATNQMVYVDPYTLRVTGRHAEQERFALWARKLHSSLLQGDGWRWMIELAASWMTVMLMTGIALWWPHARFLPRIGTRGRSAWKQWHASVGVALALVSLVILATGLTWSKYAGSQIRVLRDSIGQAPPRAPDDLRSQATGTRLGWQAAWEAARAHAPAVAMQLTAPREEGGVWRATSVDPAQPLGKFELIFDAYSGAPLYYAGWEKQTAFAKATAVGIPFHRGEFGWWNQALLLVFGLGILFSLASGWVMFFKRRKPGSFVLPPLLPGAWKSATWGMWLTAGVLLAALPLLALSAAVVLMLELLLRRA